MRQEIRNEVFDEERALYNVKDVDIIGTTFAGPQDGESALKEARDISLTDCGFSLRYPLWHTKGFTMDRVKMDELTRAAIWYSSDGQIRDSKLGGIKVFRECSNIVIEHSEIDSLEFGWNCHNMRMTDCTLHSEYPFLNGSDITIKGLTFTGKYPFQYVNNLTVEDSVLDTKDAFWNSKNVTVKNSVIKGEYLAWYSENLTLINCKIIGTQPLCYCKGLKMIDCTMVDCDLAFEYSEVQAEIKGNVLSIKNPKSGKIVCDSVGEIIREDAVVECTGEVVIRPGCHCVMNKAA
ncbi:MAG: DUF3737 family protein [Lachnospiraceae bacterium]|nr:DUF3737 family protein [Lachnospiraceae bacterium]